MEFLTENRDIAFYLSMPITLIALIVSMAYSLRNINRLWTVGTPKRQETEQESEEEEENEGGRGDAPEIDPVQYCEHIQSEVKKARQRVASKHQKLSAEEMEKEQEIQRKQIEDILKLMEENDDKFGETKRDDLQQQMRLYV
ncbi:matrix-remodeling-associated protein 7-like [Mya arenaria]|uniref:matrix-remodeling-associated protein 7-like n=1 Tax=Mya arenaria TaxID=6604 RepID=UPI0022E21DA9|nr:matrix-remodeling-associated protein 7-like [Mya arenaria]